jgi:hypothetical protein
MRFLFTIRGSNTFLKTLPTGRTDVTGSVPDPQRDPYVFGPPGFGSVIQYICMATDPSKNKQKNEEEKT